MASSLIGSNIVVTCPTYDTPAPDRDDAKDSIERAKFLQGLWRSWRYIGQRDAFSDMRFNMIVRGKAALYASWIAKDTPSSLSAYRPPILFRSLNPCNVGVFYDDVGTRIAYHTYNETIRKLRLRYPAITELDSIRGKDKTDTVKFTDYWELDESGVVWNAHLINDREFLREPQKSELPLIPIIVRAAEEFSLDLDAPIDEAVTENESTGTSVLSLLDDTLGEWEIENIVESMMVSGIKEHFFPALFYRDKTGADVPDLDLGSGSGNEVGLGFEFVDTPRIQPDYNSAAMIAARTHDRIQRGGFPDSNYGQADASARSAYLYNQLAQAGQGVIGHMVIALERICIEANTLALCMIDKFATENVTIRAYDAQNETTETYTIGAEQVSDRYNNHVEIKAAKNPDDIQVLGMALQMYQAKLLSRRTFHKSVSPFRIPEDEVDQIFLEAVEGDPDILKERIREAWFKHFGYELPPAEPDFERTPPQQEAPADLQPPQQFPGVPLGPADQGQFAPEDLTGDADVPPEVFASLIGQGGVPIGGAD